jgi:hypothetical protein
VSIPFSVTGYLCLPELLSGRGEFEHGTIVPVPKAAIDQDRGAETRKHQIRATGEVTTVQAKAETTKMQATAQDQLRLRILATNVAHVQLTLSRCQDISHFWYTFPARLTAYILQWCFAFSPDRHSSNSFAFESAAALLRAERALPHSEGRSRKPPGERCQQSINEPLTRH